MQSTNNLIIGNLSYENGDHGIDTNNSPNNTFIGNTVHGNGTTGINIEGEASTGSHHTTLINNISAGNGFTPPAGSFAGNLRVDSASITGTTLDYNLFNREDAIYQLI
ncbi:MAG: right-handed parallel beta-helix repeat-containing protein [Anaerolineales bacterium]|nr:right-handed parallel beta-helix repeat-containing protein [Anaerolineales bacterium]